MNTFFCIFFWGQELYDYMTFHKIQFNNPYGIPFNSLQTTTFLQFFMVKIPFQSHSTTCFRLRMLQISEKIHQWLINPRNTCFFCFFPRSVGLGGNVAKSLDARMLELPVTIDLQMGIISRLEWVSTLIGMDFIDFIDFLDFIDFIDWVKPSLIDVFFF